MCFVEESYFLEIYTETFADEIICLHLSQKLWEGEGWWTTG
jgi:hypothetical protein